eukprot:Protomagalhaensia_sp_Gyna_25__3320@NODE_3001_length_780_cov_14_090418_g2506_i0_p1_GENE_NODE_3001_length_780_cov_14_090418_g2506_i0NODE_3001_length_780_cov_14_090418_g2506_i0_p1_ORF_typecomplete_len244_score35_23DUF3437/PF11919_8/4_4e16CLASP_N/PF12348_8/0_083_NODE_3001_length_780_cov_14_090418_g2506_i037732
MLQLAIHPDDELASAGRTAVDSIANNPRLAFNLPAFKLFLAEAARIYGSSTDWNCRQEIVRILQVLLARHKLITLSDPNRLNLLLALFDRGLRDENTKVAGACRMALMVYITTMPHSGCQQLSMTYLSKAGTSSGVDKDSSRQKIAAIQGLAAMVDTCVFSCPCWLPATITEFARFGSRRCPDIIRALVQRTLQTFMKTHRSDWEADYRWKFNESQIVILNEFKGVPIYFS